MRWCWYVCPYNDKHLWRKLWINWFKVLPCLHLCTRWQQTHAVASTCCWAEKNKFMRSYLTVSRKQYMYGIKHQSVIESDSIEQICLSCFVSWWSVPCSHRIGPFLRETRPCIDHTKWLLNALSGFFADVTQVRKWLMELEGHLFFFFGNRFFFVFFNSWLVFQAFQAKYL